MCQELGYYRDKERLRVECMAIDNVAQERRDHFRVHQNILFDYKPVDIHAVQQKSPVQAMDAESEMAMVTALQHIDRQAAASLTDIAQKDPLMADYLARLNQKIDLIARQNVFANATQRQAMRVSLSEGGVAFDCQRALYKGNFLVLRMIFLPSYTPVLVFAQVIRCDVSGNGFRAATEFYQLSHQDRQTLAREVFKAQIQTRNRLASLEKNDEPTE